MAVADRDRTSMQLRKTHSADGSSLWGCAWSGGAIPSVEYALDAGEDCFASRACPRSCAHGTTQRVGTASRAARGKHAGPCDASLSPTQRVGIVRVHLEQHRRLRRAPHEHGAAVLQDVSRRQIFCQCEFTLLVGVQLHDDEVGDGQHARHLAGRPRSPQPSPRPWRSAFACQACVRQETSSSSSSSPPSHPR